MSSGLFGWDLLYRSVEKDIKNNQDVLVCFVHLVLVSNGFKCIGLGDSKNIDGTETKSESLPEGWNENYAIRYLHQGRLYNLRATNMDDAVMINLIRVDERTVSMVQLNTRLVAQRSGSLEQMIPEYETVVQTIRKQLIDKVVVSSKSKESSSQTTPEQQPTSSRENNPPQNVPNLYDPRSLVETNRPFNPLNVGRDDLDPFASFDPLRPGPGLPSVGGGGMLFEPPRAGPRFDPDGNLGIPRGSLPPGARFDPFRPQGPGNQPRRPNNPGDEFPPPGFDDMYM